MKSTRYFALGFAAALLMAAQVAHAEVKNYVVDADHSTVGFTIHHMFTNQTGRFNTFSGSLQLDGQTHEFKGVKGVVETASVDTRHEKRDTHLRSEDFFNVKKFPTMTFTGKGFKKKGNKTEISGDFTLLGVTKPVTLEAEFNGEGKDPWGNIRAGITAHTRINRKDFGMNFNKVLDNGGYLLGDEVDINLEIEAVQQK